MDIEDVRDYCLGKPHTTEDMPFDDTTLVFRVHKKIFALLSLDDDKWLNLKCEPEKAIELREHYAYIMPGYHMNKKHWNTVDLSGDVDKVLIFELIDHAYELIIKSLPASIRKKI